jgi:thiamine phosphate synthase YjbQ (UPF0047 family)
MSNKPRSTVTITEGRIDYVAEYAVEKGMITVAAAHGSKSTQLGGSDPEVLARTLLQELIKEGKASDCI